MIEKLSEYAKRAYAPSSRPAAQSLRRMAERGDIQGAYQDSNGRWWVEQDRFASANEVREPPPKSARRKRADQQIAELIGDDPVLKQMFKTN